MTAMFYASTFNQPLDTWDVGEVRFMQYMFFNASNFNQPLNSWDVSQVEYFDAMFGQAAIFNQPLDDWDVTGVTCTCDYLGCFSPLVNSTNRSTLGMWHE